MHGVLRQWGSFTEQRGSRSTHVWSGIERLHNTNHLLLSGTERKENTQGLVVPHPYPSLNKVPSAWLHFSLIKCVDKAVSLHFCIMHLCDFETRRLLDTMD